MIIIMRGITGSGKTTLVNQLKKGELTGYNDNAPGLQALAAYLLPVVAQLQKHRSETNSADDYFLQNGPNGREYKFDPKYLSAAHNQCLRRFTQALVDPDGPENLIVDNTNTSITEVTPYAALAGAYGHELHILTLLCDPAKAWQRNTHQVPMTNAIKQDLQLRKSILEWPPWFPQQVFCV